MFGALTTKMPSDVRELHNLLSRELSLVYTKWNYYKRLFCTDDGTVGALEQAAAFLFRIVCDVLRDDIVLTLCRITDPRETTVKGVKKRNVTIEQLISVIPASDSSLKEPIEKALLDINIRFKKFRDHRNRRIGHHDLETRLKRPGSLLPDIGIDDADSALKCMADTLNSVELYYDQNLRCYGEGIYGSGDAEEFIDFLARKTKLEEYFNRAEFGDEGETG